MRDLRLDDRLEKKPSVRASLGLYERAEANAVLRGGKKVSYKDVKEAVVSVLSHRISLKPSVKYLQSPMEFIRKEFEKFSNEMSEEEGDLP